jgi:hypothetical protein
MYLRRYHDIQISPSGVWRILKRRSSSTASRPPNGTSATTAAGNAMRSPCPATASSSTSSSSNRWPAPGRGHGASTTSSPPSTTAPACACCASTPRGVIQTDNGVEFGASFHWHVLDRGAGHVYIKPRTPRLNGKVERSHRIDAEEFYRLLNGVVIDDTKLFNDKLQEWEDFYNYHRPHGSLDGQTPYERLKQRTQARV